MPKIFFSPEEVIFGENWSLNWENRNKYSKILLNKSNILSKSCISKNLHSYLKCTSDNVGNIKAFIQPFILKNLPALR